VRALCRHFGANTVIVVGSQAILASSPDAPTALLGSLDIDAYPANAKDWEARHGIEASEEINGNFGYGSEFHRTHGYYIDGVDETTANFPPGWTDRQVVRQIDCDGAPVRIVAPEIHDLAASKLCRFDPKDKEYVAALHAAELVDPDILKQRVAALTVPDEVRALALDFIAGLPED
jgi:hypothetical protein